MWLLLKVATNYYFSKSQIALYLILVLWMKRFYCSYLLVVTMISYDDGGNDNNDGGDDDEYNFDGDNYDVILNFENLWNFCCICL